jgi:Ca-activated chloride channel family protein
MFEGIYFANPDYLWLLLLLPGMIFWHIVTWRKAQAKLKMPTLSSFKQHSSYRSFVRP